MSLDDLAHEHRTDKRSGLHGYCRFYERLFGPMEIHKLLEIGVFGGASLRMWSHYLPQAEIIGLDLDSHCVSKFNACRPVNAHALHVNAVDPVALDKLSKDLGGFDVVIDDGSHYTQDQLVSFQVLWPHVNQGGLYVVEDAFTTFLPQFNGGRDGQLFEFFFTLVREKLRGKHYSDQARTEVDSVEFSTGLIALRKAA